MVRLIWVGLFYGYLAPAIESLTALSKSYSQKLLIVALHVFFLFSKPKNYVLLRLVRMIVLRLRNTSKNDSLQDAG